MDTLQKKLSNSEDLKVKKNIKVNSGGIKTEPKVVLDESHPLLAQGNKVVKKTTEIFRESKQFVPDSHEETQHDTQYGRSILGGVGKVFAGIKIAISVVVGNTAFIIGLSVVALIATILIPLLSVLFGSINQVANNQIGRAHV